jgi:hypothetical protein
MPNLAAYFARILLGLRTMARARTLPDAAAAAMLFALSAYLDRAAQRFARLHASWLAGTLRPATPRTLPAKPRPARTEPDPALNPARPRLTRSRGWLRRALGPDAGNFGHQIVHMMLRPDMPAFLAAAPQAGRILRPILNLLATDLPAELALPPRPPRIRTPRAPRPPTPDIRWGKHNLRAIRRYSPGRIPKPISKTA